MKTIGIIGAMPSELVDIRLGLPDSEIQKKAGFDYYINQVGDTRIVHVCSGIAKVNAAVCTQALIDNFAPDAVINAGIAGGMNNDIHVCDVVVSSEVLPHDLDLHFLKDYPPYCGIYTADQALIDQTARACCTASMPCTRPSTMVKWWSSSTEKPTAARKRKGSSARGSWPGRTGATTSLPLPMKRASAITGWTR